MPVSKKPADEDRYYRPLPQKRKSPQQGRSRILVQSIKEACLHILHNEGEAALTPSRLVEVAGIEIGSLYQYFPNVDAVLGEICRAELEQLLSAEMRDLRLLQRLPLADALSHIIHVVLSFNRRMLELDAAFFARYPRYFCFSDHFNAILGNPNAAAHSFRDLVVNHRPDLATNDAYMIGFMIDRCIGKMIEMAVSEHPDYLCLPSFAERILAMCMSLVDNHAPAISSPEGRADQP